jgi:hypothetical protein
VFSSLAVPRRGYWGLTRPAGFIQSDINASPPAPPHRVCPLPCPPGPTSAHGIPAGARHGDKVDFPCCSADITTFDKDANKRSIDHNKSKTLKFKFRKKAAASTTDYQIEVRFTNGSTIHFP